MGANFQVSRRLSCMLAAGLAVFWVSIGAAQAGQEIEPAQRIGVFGDSLADGTNDSATAVAPDHDCR